MLTIKKLTGSILFLFAIHGGMAQQASPVDFVNPLIGTESKYELSNGNTYPAIARPWGMNFWTPQTGNMGTAGYILTRRIK